MRGGRLSPAEVDVQYRVLDTCTATPASWCANIVSMPLSYQSISQSIHMIALAMVTINNRYDQQQVWSTRTVTIVRSQYWPSWSKEDSLW